MKKALLTARCLLALLIVLVIASHLIGDLTLDQNDDVQEQFDSVLVPEILVLSTAPAFLFVFALSRPHQAAVPLIAPPHPPPLGY